jgi:quercetin dioxygenase-like cupin family protein
MHGHSLRQLVEEHLAAAREHSSGRSEVTVHGDKEHHLRQTLIALVGGHWLGERENPDEATLHVLHGRVRLHVGDETWEGEQDDFVQIPPERHDVEAIEDSAVLLTAAPRLLH